MEAVKIKVSIFFLGGGERSVYTVFLNENIHTGVPLSSLVIVFDYQVPFQVCGWLLCGVRNIQPQHPLSNMPSEPFRPKLL